MKTYQEAITFLASIIFVEVGCSGDSLEEVIEKKYSSVVMICSIYGVDYSIVHNDLVKQCKMKGL